MSNEDASIDRASSSCCLGGGGEEEIVRGDLDLGRVRLVLAVDD
jgi:hypothetical protein